MKRLLTLAALLVLGLFATGLYLTESEVERMRRQLANLDGELLREQNDLQVLRAEWSYLNQPERLQELATRHVDRVGLRPIAPNQIGDLASLPLRPLDSEPQVVAQSDGLPRPGFKPEPPAGVLFASTRDRR